MLEENNIVVAQVDLPYKIEVVVLNIMTHSYRETESKIYFIQKRPSIIFLFSHFHIRPSILYPASTVHVINTHGLSAYLPRNSK